MQPFHCISPLSTPNHLKLLELSPVKVMYSNMAVDHLITDPYTPLLSSSFLSHPPNPPHCLTVHSHLLPGVLLATARPYTFHRPQPELLPTYSD